MSKKTYYLVLIWYTLFTLLTVFTINSGLPEQTQGKLLNVQGVLSGFFLLCTLWRIFK